MGDITVSPLIKLDTRHMPCTRLREDVYNNAPGTYLLQGFSNDYTCDECARVYLRTYACMYKYVCVYVSRECVCIPECLCVYVSMWMQMSREVCVMEVSMYGGICLSV